VGTTSFFPRVKGRGATLTIHPHPASRLEKG